MAQVPPGNHKCVSAVDVSESGEFMVVAYASGDVVLWSLDLMKALKKVSSKDSGHTCAVIVAHFLPGMPARLWVGCAHHAKNTIAS